MAIQGHWTINEILEKYPALMDYLVSLDVDCCCGANNSLQEEARKSGVDIAALLSELNDRISRK